MKTIAKSGDIITAIEHTSKPIYGVQFHPEVDLTKNGVKMLSNFCDIGTVKIFFSLRLQFSENLTPKLAKCKRDYTDDYRDEKAINEIKSTVGDKGKILVLVSGSVLKF